MSNHARRADLDRLQWQSAVVGTAALALCLIGAFFSPSQFYRSYLVAFLFWSGIPLGCLAVLLLHCLVGGSWGFLIRQPLQSGIATFPVAAALAVPVIIGIPAIYEWSYENVVAASALLQHKRLYLNVPFFIVRTAAYFAIWIGLAALVNRWLDDEEHDHGRSAERLYALSGPGLIVYGLTVTFASVDWSMSLEPEWFSTVYAAGFMVGQVLAALALAMVALELLTRSMTAVSPVPQHLIDLGNMLLAFVVLWAYLAFSQFLIIWSGNLQDEIGWYLHRVRGGWQWVALLLVVGHFALPLLLLLSRDVKRRTLNLAWLGSGLLLMHLIDMLWNVNPAFDRETLRFHWMDPVAAIGVGGLWLTAFFAQLKRRPFVLYQHPDAEGLLPASAAGAAR